MAKQCFYNIDIINVIIFLSEELPLFKAQNKETLFVNFRLIDWVFKITIWLNAHICVKDKQLNTMINTNVIKITKIFVINFLNTRAVEQRSKA